MVTPCVYLAGPMRGFPAENRAGFDEAAERLRAGGFFVTTPHELNGEGAFLLRVAVRRSAWFIREDADVVVRLPGWEDSVGTLFEIEIARAAGKRVVGLSYALAVGPGGFV